MFQLVLLELGHLGFMISFQQPWRLFLSILMKKELVLVFMSFQINYFPYFIRYVFMNKLIYYKIYLYNYDLFHSYQKNNVIN